MLGLGSWGVSLAFLLLLASAALFAVSGFVNCHKLGTDGEIRAIAAAEAWEAKEPK